jgi:hypothetical protein
MTNILYIYQSRCKIFLKRIYFKEQNNFLVRIKIIKWNRVWQVRKVTKTEGAFTSDIALLKLVY